MTLPTSASLSLNRSGSSHWLRQLLLVLVGTAALSASSYLSIPLQPVPVSMQTFAVLMVGALYGWRLGGLTVLAWLLQALAGMPVLAGGAGGLAPFMGKTAGYLLAFPLAAMLMGWLAQRGWDGAHPLRAFVAMFVCTTLILLVGGTWLGMLIGMDKGLQFGVLPFLLGDVLKSALGAATLALWYQARKSRRGA
ncbi:biotin transporter BioY [Comamonas sp. NLF-1-9]|uniref:biotin transporter BioY n=1 Tax=Comamonas sp. NLF-1-9 TaxID=2853163 RepID=UPI001C46EC39|nr:biotin transporter BioY [Comamonas sp. NLF-1-9]QXL85719.1 biotin transporter BioY [Comamonas sp. NLF-1-9]